jgi:hypothetical protein
MSANQDDDLLSTLTPEERAAIEDVDPAEQAALAAVAAGATDPETGTNDGGEDDDADDSSVDAAATLVEGKPAATAAAAAAAPASAAQAVAQEAPAATPAAMYRAELPADHAEKKTATEQAMADLRTRFKDGDIEVDAYEAEREKLAADIEALRRAELKAEIAQEMTAQTAEAQWASAIRRQFDAAAKPEAGGIDYNTDEAKRSDLDTFVRALGAKAENNDKPMDWFLAEAHKRVLALHDIKLAAAPAAAAAPAGAKSARQAPTDALVPSLTLVPGATDNPAGDEFADLDRLDGLELEAALSRLTPAQRDKYMMGV